MRIHILGICGTFMGSLAVLAKQAGFEVTGSDQAVYPPMSTQLASQGIELMEGYDPKHLQPAPDLVLIGNTIPRGNPALEYILKQRIPFTSGPDWLAQHILKERWVLAVAGTHGKTTTTSLLAWILEYAGLNPGYLIGGVPLNFPVSARLGEAPFFVIEADEYGTACFDKRSKFIHYQPRTAIINNIEFDHADIFANLAAIKKQFHHLVLTIPGNGLIIAPGNDDNVNDVLQQGCWTPVCTVAGINSAWRAENIAPDGSEFDVYHNDIKMGQVIWQLTGQHNVQNGLAALAAAHHASVNPAVAIAALANFKGIKRRMELKGQVHGISVYDDFAHHPTAIKATLAGLRAKVGSARIIVVIEFATNTMRAGYHRDALPFVFDDADYVVLRQPENSQWDINELAHELPTLTNVYQNVSQIVDDIIVNAKTGDHIVVMSNKGFDGIHNKLLESLQQIAVNI